MSSAWLLPEHIADVLPSEAKRIEGLRRQLIDVAATYGYELVMPPLVEHLDSLLSGTGQSLGLRTFKLVDQLSGRTLGLRADTTPQVARIDAHLLNRQGVTRLCYCGPVVHTRPASPWATREPLQWGAELYGHVGLEADLEMLELALDAARLAGLGRTVVDLGHAGVWTRLCAQLPQASSPGHDAQEPLAQALAAKDAAGVEEALQAWPAVPEALKQGFMRLLELYGPVDEVLAAATGLPLGSEGLKALDELRWMAQHLAHAHPEVRVSVDLSDTGGQAYYSGLRFAVYGQGAVDAVIRGGRYDRVGAVFGRDRPAVGFSLDLKAVASLSGASVPRAAIRAPWSEDQSLRAAIRDLRSRGETVVCILPGHEEEAQEFACDRELAQVADQWVLRSI